MSHIFIECEQGTPEWLQARAGAITGSNFRDAVSTLKSGTMTAKAIEYAARVAIERVSGQPADEGFVSWQMRRGTELEPEARMAYEAKTGQLAEEAGVAKTEDGKFGYSTDGLVGDVGLIEIKCVVSPIGVIQMWESADMSEYQHQMQGGMWITGRQWCDFVMYCPQLKSVGKEIFYRRVKRDDDFISAMELQLLAFEKKVSEFETILRKEV